MKYEYSIFADYHQFYLEDENSEGDASDIWTEQTVKDLLAVAPGLVAIGTARNTDVPVEVEVVASEPNESFDEWNHVTECSLEISSGRLVIMGCTDYDPDADRITLTPDTYRVRVCYGGLNTVSYNGLEGDDRYRVVIWPGEYLAPRVVKRAKDRNKDSHNSIPDLH